MLNESRPQPGGTEVGVKFSSSGSGAELVLAMVLRSKVLGFRV